MPSIQSLSTFSDLGNLALSPRSGKAINSITDTITESEVASDTAYLKNQLRSAEEIREHVTAYHSRKKIAKQEKDTKEGNLGHKATTPKSGEAKNRKASPTVLFTVLERNTIILTFLCVVFDISTWHTVGHCNCWEICGSSP